MGALQKQVLAEQAAPILFSESDLSRPDEWVNPGSCVVVTIPNVPASAVASRPSWLPLIVTGLLKYENLTSLLHFSITRHAEYEEPIKSKVCVSVSALPTRSLHPVCVRVLCLCVRVFSPRNCSNSTLAIVGLTLGQCFPKTTSTVTNTSLNDFYPQV